LAVKGNNINNKRDEVQKSERVSYMTYEMKIQEEREEAREEGRIEEKLSSIRSMMTKLGLTGEKAMDVLDIPQDKRDLYAAQL